MNVLPLVTSLLLIFAICSYNFVHNVRTTVEEHSHFTAAKRIARSFSLKLAQDTYVKHKGQDLHKRKKSSSTPSPDAKFKSPRDNARKKPESKLNIRPLLVAGSSKKLEETAQNLLRNLYGFSTLYFEDFEELVLKTLMKTLKKHPKIESFEDLMLKLPEEKAPLFYKMIRGTNHFQYRTTKGYPSLGDYFSLEKKEKQPPPIHFSVASRALLEALYGERIAPLIINEEEHKWEEKHKHSPMTKQELESFLINNQLNPSDTFELLSFSTSKRAPKEEIFLDAKSKLKIRIDK